MRDERPGVGGAHSDAAPASGSFNCLWVSPWGSHVGPRRSPHDIDILVDHDAIVANAPEVSRVARHPSESGIPGDYDFGLRLGSGCREYTEADGNPVKESCHARRELVSVRGRRVEVAVASDDRVALAKVRMSRQSYSSLTA